MQSSRIIPAIFLCLIFSVLSGASAYAGIILNTLQGYESKEKGWSGSVDGVFSGSGGNTQRMAVETRGRIQWQGQKDRYRLQVSGGYQESNGTETGRSVVAHLRYNHDLSPSWSLVSFGQVQHNPFQRLNSRWLTGLGARYDFAKDDDGVVSLGAVPMLEVERLEDEEGHESRGRLSVFFYTARRLSSNVKMDAVAFWQPLFSDLSNARAVGNFTVTFEITGEVDLKVGAAVEDNSNPPAGVKRTDWSTFTGLGVSF